MSENSPWWSAPAIQAIFFVMLITFVAIPCLAAPVAAVYSGGSGTEASPYQISSSADIRYLSTDSGNWNKYFIVTGDIDLSGGNPTSTIGTSATPFIGTFDGQGYTISNFELSINNDNIGLFGCVGSGGEITCLGVETNANGVRGSNYVGVVVGDNRGSVTNCYATGAATATGGDAGGLIGLNYGSVTNCSAAGNATAFKYDAGGLVGWNDHGSVTNCYATGNATSEYDAGGLVGWNDYGSITNCYATGKATATGSDAGGLVGWNVDSSITNCYATGIATAPSYAGGLVGYNWDSSVTNCYRYTGGPSATGILITDITKFKDYVFLTGTSPDNGLKWSTGIISTDADSSKIWRAFSDKSEYPLFQWQVQVEQLYSGGSGTSDDPYQISTRDDVIYLSTDSENWDKHFIVTTDISLADGSPTATIGNSGTKFTGNFDGQGHTISDFTLSKTGVENVGLFGYVGSGAEIKDLGITAGDAGVTGKCYVGVLAGSNTGSITNCSATGNANASDYAAGGFVGYSEGTITNCYATGNATTGTANLAGGLVGYNNGGTITNCYATGNANAGVRFAGGLVGYNNGGTITNCYATGNATVGTSLAGGLVGSNTGTITNCYRHYNGGDNSRGTYVPDLMTLRDTAFLTGDELNNGLKWSAGIISTSADSTKVWRAFTYKSQYPIFQWQSFGTGTIQVNSTPAGANISLNGVATGSETNATLSAIPAGTYNISAAKSGYDTGYQSITLTGDATASVNFILVQQVGTLQVNSTPAGALISINGSSTGNYTNATFSNYLPGTYNVTVERDGYIPSPGFRTVTLSSGETETAAFTLVQLYSGGNGTAANPYQISTRDDVIYLSTDSGNWDKHFIVTTDISLADGSPTATIGNSGTEFTGNFDGQGHTISEFTIINWFGSYIGFFGYVDSGAEISNLRITASDAGVSGSNNVGVLAGYNTGILTNCYATGNATASGDYAGGLVGESRGTLTNCSATGSATASEYAGGLVGHVFSGTFTNCYATGDATATESWAGGLVGYFNSGTLTNCSATGNATTTASWAGGLVGFCGSSSITNCSATGDATAGDEYAGGLVGQSYGSITNCYATGNANARYDCAGGLAGSIRSDGSITNCYATGNATARNDYAGGLVAENMGAITNSYATGSATAGGSNTGGLIGYNKDGTLTNCYRHYNSGGCFNGTYVSDPTTFRDIDFLTGDTPDDGLGWSTGNISTSADLTKVWRAFTYKGQYPIFQWQSFGTGTIRVNSTPDGADISLNGVATESETNATLSQLSGGEYNVTVVLAGYKPDPAFSVVTLESGDTETLDFTLTKYSGGTGTSDNPYKISTEEDLIGLSTISGDWGAYFILTNDIALVNSPTETIGSSGTKFTGSFDGQGYTISNFVMNKSSSDYVGLFGYLDSDGEIKNLGVEAGDSGVFGKDYVGILAGRIGSGSVTNCSSTGSVSASGSSGYAGGLVGYIYSGSITECSATGNATASTNAGGLVGYIYYSATISNCSATGNVTASGEYAGGLVGRVSRTSGGSISITNCSATGSVSAGSYAGGLAGFAQYSGSTLRDCSATGSVTASSNYAGGLVGRIDSGSSIINCSASGRVDGSKYAGGLVGYFNYGNIINCSASGSATAGADGYAGGLAGYIYSGDTTITDCSATGNATASGGDYAGGLVGYAGYSSTGSISITNCSATGNAGARSYAGGLVGYVKESDSTIRKCYATGSATGSSSFAGGLVGKNDGSSIITCYATGNAAAEGAGYAGGLVGYSSGGITNCYGTGTATAGNYNAGGLVGQSSGGITNCYATGNATVTRYDDAGGLVGTNSGTITNSYAIGSAAARSYARGLVGSNSGTITNCYRYTAGGSGTPIDDLSTFRDYAFLTGTPGVDPSTDPGLNWSAAVISTDADSSKIWRAFTYKNNYPIFQWQSYEEGTIQVNSIPEGASVSLNGVDTGSKTNATLTDMAAGTYTVTVAKSGYLSDSQTVLLAGGATEEVDITLISPVLWNVSSIAGGGNYSEVSDVPVLKDGDTIQIWGTDGHTYEGGFTIAVPNVTVKQWDGSPVRPLLTNTSNTAPAITITADNATLQGLTISGNTFAGAGAGVQALGTIGSHLQGLTITGCVFTGNGVSAEGSDDSGGAVCITYVDDSCITDTTFTGNTAGEHGGAVLITTSPSPVLTDVVFTNNSAKYRGGGVYIRNSAAPVLTRTTFTNNTAGTFGAGASYYDADDAVVTGATFTNNTANYGGGCYFEQSDTPEISGTAYTDNTANYNGGGCYFISSPSADIQDTTFTRNTGKLGGGSQFYNSALAEITNVTYTDNTASSEGGSCYLASSSDVVFTNISADTGSGDDFSVSEECTGVIFTNLTMGDTDSTSVSFTFGGGMKIAGATVIQPADPTGYANISHFVNVTAPGWMLLNVSYTDADVAGLNASSLSMWDITTGSTWGEVAGTNGVNTVEKYVYARLESLSSWHTIAPFANITGTLQINSTPSNGWIWIDGVNRSVQTNATVGGLSPISNTM
ncbi:PEGA domain-containing protein [Methanogenium sp. S4BF]|uniref:beta strand repeat-containing protein n=1 Tax=Methanogenium sp. S4BF TaxID=1789226 RepID=UPI0024161812|nr:GLUG motif-containing protein [Methanogenium sp. S4BF]WFN35648.1 PEGA domain-containing protein [Methanogenium sp. S4BF]